MTALAVSQALSWIVIAALVMVVWALTRQIGLLHERIAPVGALITDAGPGVGAALPRFQMERLDGGTRGVGGAGDRPRLLLFVAADCPVCKRVAPVARALARDEGIELILVGDGDAAPLRAMVRRLGLSDVGFVLGSVVGRYLQIGKLPTAVLIDAAGMIRGKGLVNSREHLDSLLIAQESGHGSLNDFLRGRADAAA